MTYNTDLMLQVREVIKMNPEQHNQEAWEDVSGCGTTRCIAGWAIHLATDKNVHEVCGWVEEEQRWVDEDIEAASLLGISPGEAGDLFYCLDDARALAKLDALIEKAKNQ